MSLEEIKQRRAYFKEFREILVRRHGQNYYSSYHNQNRVTIDEAALRFGRYLSAARSNANLTINELAAQTKISEAILTALEEGLILACDIRPRWLKRLAKALAENIDDFNLLLGRNIVNSKSNSRWFTRFLTIQGQSLLAFSKASLLSKPIYGACSAILLCVLVSAFIFLGVDFFEQPPPKKEINSSIVLEPDHQPDLFRADPGLDSQVFVEPSQPRSLPIQAHNSSGIARKY